MGMDRSTQLWLYEMMFRIRRFEESVIDLFARGKIPGFLHSYLGEEAIATGACAHLRKDDYIISTHRGHGHILAKGARTDLAMAELFGKRTGYCNGKGGSMHIADPDIGILGANGIVGAGLVIANGAALSAQYRGTDQVCVCFFGDGASSQGTFNEGLNLAAVWKLPVVFVCENNAYAMSTQPCDGVSVKDVAVRAAAYGIPGVTVNGNDVLAVYGATGKAIEDARAGKGPSLVEAKTYRIRGHYEGDPQTYRAREEVDEWRMRCPISCYRESLLKNGVSEEELKAIDSRVEAELLEAIEFADKSPLPDVSEARHGIFTEVAEVA
jgi:pyruvate dehydrogenase E1 component alpha subunit